MKKVIEAAVKSNIEGLNELFKSYKISKPVTAENLALAVLHFGDPFIADLDEFIMMPTAKLISSFSEEQLSCFDGDDGIYSNAIGRRKKKDGEENGEEKEGIFAKMKKRKALAKGAEDYQNSEPKERRKGLGGAIIGGLVEIGGNAAGVIKGIKGQFKNSETGEYEEVAEEVTTTEKLAKPEKEKNKYLMYVGIVAAIVVVLAIVLMVYKKK